MLKWILVGCLATRLAMAAVLSNPVPADGIRVDSDRGDWDGIPSYPEDPQDNEQGLDLKTIFFAHDDGHLYLRYLLYGGPRFQEESWRYNIFIDADQNRSSGYLGGGGQFSIGAEWLLQGPYLYRFTGETQTQWSWEQIGGEGSWSEAPGDVELAFSLDGWLQGVSAFNWIAMADDTQENEWRFRDYLPDGADGGPAGTWHTYAIPEPRIVVAPLACALLGAAVRHYRLSIGLAPGTVSRH